MTGCKKSWRFRPVRPPLGLFAVLLCVAGCDNADRVGPKGANPGSTTSRVVTTGPAGSAAIRGVVSFKGTPPEGEEIDGSRCHTGAGTIRVAPVAVGSDGGLKDVIAYVKDPAVAPGSAPDAPAVLDQVNCRYVPHVLGVSVGQVLRVKSSDPTMHNVHTLSDVNPSSNFGMTRAGESRDLKFERPERFAVKCDVHPWMTAHVYVLDHPFFAVTGDDGRFEIKGLPAGEHTLVFSHPFLGDRERRVTVETDGAVAELDVTFGKGEK
jgi:plastocyanin